MHNWNTDTSKWNKKSSSFKIWKLEQLINFGLNGEKLDSNLLKKYWSKIYADTPTKNYLKLLLWPKLS